MAKIDEAAATMPAPSDTRIPAPPLCEIVELSTCTRPASSTRMPCESKFVIVKSRITEPTPDTTNPSTPSGRPPSNVAPPPLMITGSVIGGRGFWSVMTPSRADVKVYRATTDHISGSSYPITHTEIPRRPYVPTSSNFRRNDRASSRNTHSNSPALSKKV